MALFGTIGLFVKNLSLPSSMIALARSSFGVLFLLLIICIKRMRLSMAAIHKNLLWLSLSGIFLGFNWILMFESYHYTSVAVSTLCYYMAPIIVILLSPLLKEKLTARKILCVLAALAGMICLSGVLQELPTGKELKGIFLALIAAMMYAAIVMLNKKLQNISAYEKTVTQLGISALVLIPYCLFTVNVIQLDFSGLTLPFLVILGVVHTGFTYFLYFGAMEHVSAQTTAIISYIDPVVAVLCSVLLLQEPMLASEGIGALLILGAAFVSELPIKEKSGSQK